MKKATKYILAIVVVLLLVYTAYVFVNYFKIYEFEVCEEPEYLGKLQIAGGCVKYKAYSNVDNVKICEQYFKADYKQVTFNRIPNTWSCVIEQERVY